MLNKISSMRRVHPTTWTCLLSINTILATNWTQPSIQDMRQFTRIWLSLSRITSVTQVTTLISLVTKSKENRQPKHMLLRYWKVADVSNWILGMVPTTLQLLLTGTLSARRYHFNPLLRLSKSMHSKPHPTLSFYLSRITAAWNNKMLWQTCSKRFWAIWCLTRVGSGPTQMHYHLPKPWKTKSC